MIRRMSIVYTMIVFALLAAATAKPADAVTEKVLHSFTGSPDGIRPEGSLIFDAEGNLYGVTLVGGVSVGCNTGFGAGCGIVYELKPSVNHWREKILYTFKGGPDGGIPWYGVIVGRFGELYGTASQFGMCQYCGVAYELPTSAGSRREVVLYAFPSMGSKDGQSPRGMFAAEPSGALVSTTEYGGAYNNGTVFAIEPSGVIRTVTVLHSFDLKTNDAGVPESGVLRDHAGNLFGTSEWGGAYNMGAVYGLEPEGNGYRERVLASLPGGAGGCLITSEVIADADGNLFGTTDACGPYMFGYGVVFELEKRHAFRERVIYAFNGYSGDGFSPDGLVADSKGNLYGTARMGGPYQCSCGIAYELVRNGNAYAERVLWNFTGGADGGGPAGPMIFDGANNLYGVANYGGTHNVGVVFEISP